MTPRQVRGLHRFLAPLAAVMACAAIAIPELPVRAVVAQSVPAPTAPLNLADGGRHGNNGSGGHPGQICLRAATISPSPTASNTATPTLTPLSTASSTATWTPHPTTTPTASWTPRPPTTPTATWAPSSTTTPTATWFPTPTTTPTATPKTVTLRVVCYLPLVLREDCPKVNRQPVAVVIVLDTSSSMTELQHGRTKLGAAINAALVAVNALVQPEDAIGLVTFNSTASVLAGLTSDPAVLRRALAQLPTGLGTRLDEGIKRGGELLAGARADSRRRLVVLTDGLPNPSTPADALAAAAVVRAAGVSVDAIGLGDDVDAALLAAIAGEASRYHAAPGPEDLESIFVDLRLVPSPCVGLTVWPRRAALDTRPPHQ